MLSAIGSVVPRAAFAVFLLLLSFFSSFTSTGIGFLLLFTWSSNLVPTCTLMICFLVLFLFELLSSYFPFSQKFGSFGRIVIEENEGHLVTLICILVDWSLQSIWILTSLCRFIVFCLAL